MKTNEGRHRALALSLRRRQGAAAYRGRQGFRPAVVARRQVDRVHRQAQGRRRSAGLPDRAGRRRGATPDDAVDGRVGAALVSRQPPHRLRVLGLARPRQRQGAGEAQARAQSVQDQGARDRACRAALLGPLACRWPRAARVRGRRRQRQRARSARRHRACASALGSVRRALRPESRRQGARADRRPGPRAADDEFRRYRRRPSGDRPAPHADRGQRIFQRASALFARRQASGLARVQPEARVQRSGPPDPLRARQRPHAASCRQARPRDQPSSTGRPTARRCTC